ncbi:MAG: redox-regulated ATPase YchF, partial [Nitrospira sp.]|nr:redox-regulated ATPase YchF [Nitrospira sp.]
MKLAIIGLSNSGKTTIFNALTGQNIETTIYPTTIGEPHIGIVKVPDVRVDKLSQIFKPKKTVHATVEYIDYIGITKGDIQQNRKVFDLIKDVDAIVHVVRAFQDDSVIHPMGNIDPSRDVETIELELIFGDLEFIEKRLKKMEEGIKRGKKPDDAEKRLLLKCKESLEKEIPLRDAHFNDEEQKAMRHLQFISTKPEIVALNIGEKDLSTDKNKKLEKEIKHYFESKQIPLNPPLLKGGMGGLKTHHSLLSLCGKIEMELARLSPADAK